MTWLRRRWEWLAQHPMAVDGLVTAILVAAAIPTFTARNIPGEVDGSVVSAVVLLASILPVAWRRVHPVAAMTIIGFTAVAYEVFDFPDTGVNAVSVLLGLYAVSALGSRKASVRSAVLSFVGVGIVLWANIDQAAGIGNVISNYLIFGTAWVIGDNTRQRKERIAALEDRAALAELSKEDEAAKAVAAERTRIARELHDVVAHSVSVMVVQAGAARRLLSREEPDPVRAVEALESVELTGRESLNELRRLLGVLRRDDDRSFGRVPQPSIRYVDSLVDQSRDAGLDVALVVEGDPRPLAPGVDLTAYRIVQEALTNALKHAGPGVHAKVHVCYTDAVLEIYVSDDGRGSNGDRNTGGHGLVGMHERVRLFGGTLDLGNRTGGGFEVRASLPLDAA